MKAELRRAWPLSGLLQMNWSNVVQEAALLSQSGPRAAQGEKKQKKKHTKKTASAKISSAAPPEPLRPTGCF